MLSRSFGVLAAVVASLAFACSSTVSNSDASDVVRDGSDVQADAQDAQPDTADVPTDAGPSGIGNPCTGSGTFPPVQGDCADGQLCLEDNAGFPGGYCIQDCSTSDCPSDSACVMGGGGFSVCLLRCTTDMDCRAEDGYVCRMSMAAGAMVCVPTNGPIGERDGGACYTTTAGPNQLPALQHHVFGTPNVGMSGMRTDSRSAAEGNLVISPTNGHISGSYIALGSGGTVFMGSSTTADGMHVDETGRVTEPMLRNTSDPVLTYTQDGRLWMIYIAYNFDRSGNMVGTRIRVANSTDDGHTWSVPVGIEPLTTCASGCDKPWITTGPAPMMAGGGDGGVDAGSDAAVDGGLDADTDAAVDASADAAADGGGASGENIYAAFLAEGARSANLMLIRSEDHGMTWSAPVAYAGIESVGGSQVVPNLQTLVVGPDGVLHSTYAGLGAAGGMTENYGSTMNRIVYRRSIDGGRTWGPPHAVSGPTDSPVYNQPFMALDGNTIYVVYTSGTINGAWDIMLATSTDGGVTWIRRKVNDEPDACATHYLPQLAADPVHHLAHVTWIENRFGPGAAAYANCPQDPTMPCGRNEALSDQTFAFTTSRDPSGWYGDYEGIALAPNGTIWAYWADTRTMTPQTYLAAGLLP